MIEIESSNFKKKKAKLERKTTGTFTFSSRQTPAPPGRRIQVPDEVSRISISLRSRKHSLGTGRNPGQAQARPGLHHLLHPPPVVPLLLFLRGSDAHVCVRSTSGLLFSRSLESALPAVRLLRIHFHPEGLTQRWKHFSKAAKTHGGVAAGLSRAPACPRVT